MRLFTLAVLLTVLSACTTRRMPVAAGPYHLEGAPAGYVLTPPLPLRGRTLVLGEARTARGRDAQCGVALPEIGLQWRGRTAEVQVSEKTLGPQGPVALEGGPVAVVGEAVRDLSWWGRFREQLDAREAEGCLKPREAARLAGRVLENLRVTPSLAYQLRYGNYAVRGYFDLEQQFVLKSVAPLLKPGVARYRTVDDVRGYETAYYDLKPRGGGGLRVALKRVEQNVGGNLRGVRKPENEILKLPESAPYIRLFFRSWSVRGDRRIALLATPRLELLDPLTRKFEENAEGFCAAANPREAVCISVPKEMVIGPELRVTANGREAFVPVGGSVMDVLRFVGVKPSPEVNARIHVTRPYAGAPAEVEFDRKAGDILRLVLVGGEVVSW
jgi:hypothetical protein